MAQAGLVVMGVVKVSGPDRRMLAKHVGLLLSEVHMANTGSVGEVVFPSCLTGVVVNRLGLSVLLVVGV